MSTNQENFKHDLYNMYSQMGSEIAKQEKKLEGIPKEIIQAAYRDWVVDTSWFRDNSRGIANDIVQELKSYTKSGSTGRFFSGAWRRTFGKEIDKVIENFENPRNGCRDATHLINKIRNINVNGKNPFQSTGAFRFVKEKIDGLVDQLVSANKSGTDLHADWKLCRDDAVEEYIKEHNISIKSKTLSIRPE